MSTEVPFDDTELISLAEAEAEARLVVPDVPQDASPEPKTKKRLIDSPRYQFVSAETLQATRFTPLEFCVDRVLVPGLTVLAGRPKEGKSWLALELSYAIAHGTVALGQLATVPGDVLYLALEDNRRRLQDRLSKIRAGEEWPPRLAFGFDCPALDKGGLELIADWCRRADKPKLVVVDVFARVRPSAASGTSAYEADYAATAPLQEFAVKQGIAIVLVHHTRKMAADDPLEEVSGTNGLTGAADTILVLKREAINSGDAVLYGRGRDIPEFEMALAFSNDDCRWRLVGEAGSLRASKETQAIIDVLEAAGEPMGPKAVWEALEGVALKTVQKRMKRMAMKGEIARTSYGSYTLVGLGGLEVLME